MPNLEITLTFTPQQARWFIHSDLEVSEEQLKECVVTFLNDNDRYLKLKQEFFTDNSGQTIVGYRQSPFNQYQFSQYETIKQYEAAHK